MRDLQIKGYTVAQFPNAPLLAAIAGLLASWVFSEKSLAYSAARAVFFVGLAIWAWEELSDGVNGFRRVLGALGLAYVLVGVTRGFD